MKYITLESGTDFRKIAKIMTDNGFVMNHATARNVLMSSLEQFFNNIAIQLNEKIPGSRMKEMLKSQHIHNSLSDILFVAYKEHQQEEKE